MNAKKTILKIITDAGEKGIRLDRIVDKLNAQFPSKYYSDQFIIDFLNKRQDIEQIFIHLNKRTLLGYKVTSKDKKSNRK